MARRRFFVPEVRRGVAELTGEDADHLVRVLRAETGQVYEISDNQQVYLAEITTARKSLVTFSVREELPQAAEIVHVKLVAALIKFDRFEWLIEKATELGVGEIRPFVASRTEHGLAHAAVKRMARWERIALEASQQSRRARLPIVHPPVRFEAALESKASTRFLLDEDVSAPAILDRVPADRRSAAEVALMLGPEGGWTDEERRDAIETGWQPVSLCGTVLRAETAAVAGLAIIQAAWAQNRNVPVSPPPATS